jgi:thiol-disulfide isomerase/thioredoxin
LRRIEQAWHSEQMRWPVALRLLLVLGVLPIGSCRGAARQPALPTAAAATLPVVVPLSGPQLLDRIGTSLARAVVLNVWATWCTTCRAELPDLMKLRRDYRADGLEVLFVSADFASELPQVREFLRLQGVDFTTYIRQGEDMAFIDALQPDWSGALPATFVYDHSGRLVRWWQGSASYETFVERVRDLMPAGGAP